MADAGAGEMRMRILGDKQGARGDRPCKANSLPASFAGVEPASTFATLDKFQDVAICSWPLICKAIRVSPPFGISTANVEVSARDVVRSLA